MAQTYSLKLGTIGLPEAGKTIWHTVLYGRQAHFDGVLFRYLDSPTIRYLNPMWEALDRGNLPDATGLARPSELKFQMHTEDASGNVLISYAIHTMDYAGILVNRGASEDTIKQARELGLEQFIDECDLLMVMVDLSDDSQAVNQLNTLDYILQRCKETSTQHGSKNRPVAVAFTKVDQVFSQHMNSNLIEMQSVLLEYLSSKDRWRGMHRALRALKDYNLYEVFPVSCFGTSCAPGQNVPTAGTINPKWIHEPLIWGLPRAAELANQAITEQQDEVRRIEKIAKDAENNEFNTQVTLAILCITLGAIIGYFIGWGIGFVLPYILTGLACMIPLALVAIPLLVAADKAR
ncbi:MAG: GTPase domain-containing protein [Zavarzinella sp.]